MAEAWLRREIKDGLQALVALALDNQPAAEILPLTADIWLRAIERASIGCDIEALDAPRIREGFNRLFPNLRRWPVPAQLIELIPGRPERSRLAPPPLTDEQHAEGKRRLKELQERLASRFNLPETVSQKARVDVAGEEGR